MNAIVAVDKNWGIGKDNKLLANVPEDMKNFVAKTKGKIIIVGRKTLESFKDGKPLKDRVNIVLTKNIHYKCTGAIIVNSLEDLFELLKTYPFQNDIFVCGGEGVYKQLLPYCEFVYVTKLDKVFEADTYFPNLDIDNDWELVDSGIWEYDNDIPFKFSAYRSLIK